MVWLTLPFNSIENQQDWFKFITTLVEINVVFFDVLPACESYCYLCDVLVACFCVSVGILLQLSVPTVL